MRQDPREAALLADEQARFSGALRARKTIRAPRGPAIYLLTSAQNNTLIHDEFWRNLLAYSLHLGAKLLVSQFTYNKSGYLRRDGTVKPGSVVDDDLNDLWYAEEIKDYTCNARMALSKSLVFCGEVNILPTAARPLSGFENYTERASGIFPHAKQVMESIPSLHAAKFNYTTGCCTLRNYLQKKAGLKAEYQHAYGALIVEVDADGGWFVRQIRATEDGAFQDWTTVVRDGKVSTGNRVEAIWWGDVHVEQMDPVVRHLNWGSGGGGIIDELRPRYQFMNDTLDFKSRNHHEMGNPHEMFRKHARGIDSVEGELRRAAEFMAKEAHRPWCKMVVVDSNHDQALTRWLREADFREDPANALAYLDLQKRVYKALAAGDGNFNLFRDVMRHMGVTAAVQFLATDESFLICKAAGGIECGIHGHNGLNGGRGTPRAFARIGRRVNTGHTHSAGIIDDCFTAGTCSIMRMGYNRGASSWSHSDILTYSNGCRTIITKWRGKARGRRPDATKTLPSKTAY